jgi:hypothetical protein
LVQGTASHGVSCPRSKRSSIWIDGCSTTRLITRHRRHCRFWPLSTSHLCARMLCTLGFAGDLGFERNAPFAFAVVCACGVNIWHCEKTVRIRIQLLRMKKEQIAVRERTKPRRQLAAFTTFMVDCCDSLCYQQQQNHSCLTRLLIAKSGDPRRNLLGAVVHWRRETHTHHYCLEKSLLCVIVVWDCGRLWSIRATWQYPSHASGRARHFWLYEVLDVQRRMPNIVS